MRFPFVAKQAEVDSDDPLTIEEGYALKIFNEKDTVRLWKRERRNDLKVQARINEKFMGAEIAQCDMFSFFCDSRGVVLSIVPKWKVRN